MCRALAVGEETRIQVLENVCSSVGEVVSHEENGKSLPHWATCIVNALCQGA